MPKARAVKLLAFVGDDRVWEAKPANNIFPHETLDFSNGDYCQDFGFNPFCKVVYGKFELSLALWYGADEVQSPLCERPRTAPKCWHLSHFYASPRALE